MSIHGPRSTTTTEIVIERVEKANLLSGTFRAVPEIQFFWQPELDFVQSKNVTVWPRQPFDVKSQQMKAKIGIIESQRLVLDLLRDRLNCDSELAVVAAGTEVNSIWEMIQNHQVDLLLIDPTIESTSVFESISALKVDFPSIRIAFLGSYPSNFVLSQVLELDLAGYLLKSDPLELWIAHVKRIVAGEKVFSDLIQVRIAQDFDSSSQSLESDSRHNWDLTPRQLDVLRVLARGLSVKEAASELQLSQKSVDSHKYRLMGRLNLHDRVELTLFALREHLIQL